MTFSQVLLTPNLFKIKYTWTELSSQTAIISLEIEASCSTNPRFSLCWEDLELRSAFVRTLEDYVKIILCSV